MTSTPPPASSTYLRSCPWRGAPRSVADTPARITASFAIPRRGIRARPQAKSCLPDSSTFDRSRGSRPWRSIAAAHRSAGRELRRRLHRRRDRSVGSLPLSAARLIDESLKSPLAGWRNRIADIVHHDHGERPRSPRPLRIGECQRRQSQHTEAHGEKETFTLRRSPPPPQDRQADHQSQQWKHEQIPRTVEGKPAVGVLCERVRERANQRGHRHRCMERSDGRWPRELRSRRNAEDVARAVRCARDGHEESCPTSWTAGKCWRGTGGICDERLHHTAIQAGTPHMGDRAHCVRAIVSSGRGDRNRDVRARDASCSTLSRTHAEPGATLP